MTYFSKKKVIVALAMTVSFGAMAQENKDKGKVEVYDNTTDYFHRAILKDGDAVDERLEAEAPEIKFVMDQSEMDLPNDPSLYATPWSQPTISQGNTGTCWCFSTSSFFESEVKRMYDKEVKVSEMYTVYWEYVEKSRRYIETRGNSFLGQGSESNAVTRMMKMYGAVPADEYDGMLNGRNFLSHERMFNEIKSFLESLKASNAWNVEYGLATVKSILKHYIGEPPLEFQVEGKTYNPQTYLKEYLKLNPDDYVEILSYKQEPYWEQVEYKVPDNWWHSKDYYNVPLDDFMSALKKAVKKGYTVSIGGDITETGISSETNCAIIPDYDIPSAYINEDSRQFRFSNGTTTDDHGMHLIGILENYKDSGTDWYLVKDSWSDTRNVNPADAMFGYYFFSDDYIKLKMMGYMIHKDAVKTLLKKF